MRWVAIPLAAMFVFVFTASTLADSKSSKPGKTEIEGVITTVAPQGGVVVVRGEKGRTWIVVVDLATEIKFEEDDDDFLSPARIHDLQVGHKVEVKGIALGNGRVLALKIKVDGERPSVGLPSAGPLMRGVVVVISSKSLVVITQDGTLIVVIQAGTRFVEKGRRVTRAALGRNDVVLVRGQAVGGRLMAEEVTVEFDASEGVVLTGVIGILWLQGGAFLLAGMPIWVNVTSRTFIIHEQSPTTFGSMRPNGSVVVYGLGKGTAMQAVVIVVR